MYFISSNREHDISSWAAFREFIQQRLNTELIKAWKEGHVIYSLVKSADRWNGKATVKKKTIHGPFSEQQ